MGRGLSAVVVWALVGCSSSAVEGPPVVEVPSSGPIDVGARPALSSVQIAGMPHVRQRPDFCGEACLEMAARRLGSPLTQDDAFLLAAVDPSLGRGAYTRELAKAAEGMGFRTGPVWFEVDGRTPGPGLASLFEGLHADLARGVPSIVCMRWDDDPQPEHFRLVTGFDAEKDEVVYQEPAEDDGGDRRMDRATFLSRWPLRYGKERWTVVRIALEPAPSGLVPRPTPAPGPSPADLSQHVQALKPRLPPGFSVVVERPFVVIGNGGPEAVETSAQNTVRFAVDRLERDFFRKAPEKVLEVWLFRDAPSYEKGVRELTGEAPGTPYGFYSSRRRGLFMNIATGGGTLVHEIVHPYVEADLPAAPSWVNEGLGSLFEQSADRNGRIVGLTNWRLAGLQQAIRERRVPPFRELVHTDSDAFYDDPRGTHYAQSRYLMLWLQERGALVPFVRSLHGGLERDPSGWTQLLAALGETDMAAFQDRWETWVLGLTFP